MAVFATADALPASSISQGARGAHVFCDNTVACAHIASLGARSPHLAPLTRLLAATCAHRCLSPFVTQVKSEDNADANALSRLSIPPRFLSSRWQRLHYSPQQLLSLVDCKTHPLAASALTATLRASATTSGVWPRPPCRTAAPTLTISRDKELYAALDAEESGCVAH